MTEFQKRLDEARKQRMEERRKVRIAERKVKRKIEKEEKEKKEREEREKRGMENMNYQETLMSATDLFVHFQLRTSFVVSYEQSRFLEWVGKRKTYQNSF